MLVACLSSTPTWKANEALPRTARRPNNLRDPLGLDPCDEPGEVTKAVNSASDACELEGITATAKPRRRWPASGASSNPGSRGSNVSRNSSSGGGGGGGGKSQPQPQQCPNVTPAEMALAMQADYRSSRTGTEEGFRAQNLGVRWFTNLPPAGTVLFSQSIDGPGVRKGRGFISGPIPLWTNTIIHAHPSGRGISEGDSIYAYTYGVRVVSGSARTGVFGSINPGGQRVTCDLF